MLLLMDYKCNVRQNKIKCDQQNTNYLHIAHSFFDLDKVEIEHLTSSPYYVYILLAAFTLHGWYCKTINENSNTKELSIKFESKIFVK